MSLAHASKRPRTIYVVFFPFVMSTFELTVKSPDRVTYTVRVNPEWTIDQVKRAVSQEAKTPNLDIVFCGQRLEGHKKLKVRLRDIE